MRAVLFLFVLLLLPSAAWADDLTLDAASDHIIAVEVNGHPLRLKVDPGSSGYLILNPAAARAAGLKGSLIGSQTSIGPVVLDGKSNRVRLTVDGSTTRQRVVWVDRDVTTGADGIISPAALPFDNVTLELSAGSARSATFVLPMRYDHGLGLFFPYSAGGDTIIARLSTVQPLSMATASAAAVIAAAQGGSWSAEPRREHIRFAVERPVRPMALSRPVDLSGFAVDRFLVRISDNRGGHRLPADAPADPDEIVVAAKAKDKQPRNLHLTLGVDRLGACQSVTYRRASQSLALRCND